MNGYTHREEYLYIKGNYGHIENIQVKKGEV